MQRIMFMTISLSFALRFGQWTVSLLVLMLGASLLVQGQTIRYVRVNGTNNNPATATTWGNSTTNLQGAINASNPGDQVWVATGVYKPGGNANTSRTVSFAMKNGVRILGGFAGSGTPTLAQRNPSSLTTVLSGDLGVVGNYVDNAYHVISNPTGLTNTAVLDGFVITWGNANGNADDQNGGGMINVNTSPTVTGCVFQRNVALVGSGGGMYNSNSNPSVSSCSFQGNSASDGGGMSNKGSAPSLSNCSFQNNSAGYGGGLVNLESSNPSMTTCSFVSNTASYGGGMSNLMGSSPRLTGCSFQSNSATTGGGMFNDGSGPNVDACTFLNNRTTGSGGGMYNDGSSPTVTNCTFQSNTATSGGNGGGMYNDGSSPTVTTCGFQSNSATTGGGIYNVLSSSPRLTGCSFQSNSATTGGGMFTDSGSPTVDACTFLNNKTTGSGGGMYNLASNLRVTTCRFERNTASGDGGGISNKDSDLRLTSCNFLSNSVTSYGGGVFNEGNNYLGLINCVFLSNSANYGGGITNSSSSATVTNCSFLNNSFFGGGGGIYNIAANDIILTNCVLFGNGGANTFYYTNSVTVRYSLLEPSVTSYTNGGNNLITPVSPFVSSTDIRLNGCSPAINTGNNAGYTTNGGPTNDLAGSPRFFNNGVIDRGAYEYQAAPASLTLTVPSVNTATVGIAFSQHFVAAGGTSPYSYSLASGSLPTGLSLATTGVLSGTPTQAGSFTLTVLGRDATGCSASSAAYRLTVSAPPTTLTGLAATPTTVCVGSPVTFTATVGNLTSSYSYTLWGGSNPISGTGTTSAFSQSLTATGSGVQTFTLTVSRQGQVATATTSVTVTNLYSLKAGDWTDGSVWSCGRIPLLSDAVTLNHVVNLPASYQGQVLQVLYSASGRLVFGTGSKLRLGGN
ncbi:right-handed parallel beta-helix repeat-containing protein [Spirosoma sp. BT702]|uniref:Right-handed parallel beta-helix repeat-containing protein n=1 Tax=Spirosoma profusum TaxID=2771354 RepID=A0A927GA20_9BACT|nr:right-handed parallel beta-helix repeat-containing protein [Spirosoma profusum]MBD2705187.1 right-handed parallel beta-helix repeat-containing protein [Spirosoma profusum]